MILAKTRYKMYDAELLTIIKVFKNWRHYLEGCKYKVLLLTNHNNLCRFIDIKSLSSCLVYWAQKLSHYHFRIDYCQDKANRAADALSYYFQRSRSKEEIFQAENTRILQCLQSLLTNARASSTPAAYIVFLKQVIIGRTHTFLELYQSWKTFCQELLAESPYQASIEGMRLRLIELQIENGQAQKIKVEKLGRN